MLSLKVDISRYVASLDQKMKARLPVVMQKAVRSTAATLLRRIVDRTPKPPTPSGQIYIRTGRLVAGWRPAGEKLGVSVPEQSFFPSRLSYYGAPPRGKDLPFPGWQEKAGPDEISFLMRNNVPYAVFVEEVGPGFPVVGVGVHMVLFSMFDTLPDFHEEVRRAWSTL